MKYHIVLLSAALICLNANAGDTLDAAIGGAVGGGVGAAIGHEVGGRDGAIVGGAIGGAAGAAVATDGQSSGHYNSQPVHTETHIVNKPARSHPHGSGFCPPGQAKKGRC
jgi:hypothetical protein